MRCVILAAGKGTRMFPLAEERPKPLLTFAGRTILEHQISRLRSAGIRDIVIVVPPRSREIRDLAADIPSSKVSFIEQRSPRGTGDALRACETAIDERFMCVNGDVLFDPKDIRSMARSTGEVVAGCRSADPGAYGVLVTSGKGVLKGIIEKPTHPGGKALINAGIYIFGPRIFEDLRAIPRSPRGEYELTDAVPSKDMRIYELKGRWMDLGYPWNLLDANEMVMGEMKKGRVEGEVMDGSTLSGPVSIGKGTMVLPGCYIQGPVMIGEGCRIGPNTYIRPSTFIGNNCHVGSATEVKNSIIMDGSNLPHMNYVGDSVIGVGCNLGAGTKIANLRLDGRSISAIVKGRRIDTHRRKFGAVLGHNVKTGINASICVGTIIGSNAYIGMGAKVSGTIRPGSRIH